MYGPSRPEPRPKPAERVAPFHMDDDGKQEDRKEFIQQRIADGLFLRVGYDGGTLPKVWVSQRFLMLDIKTRNTLLEVVYAYYSIEDDSFGMTADGLMCLPLGVKIDDGTIGGKTIGEYDPVDGLR